MLSIQMMELIYKKKMAYFESGGDEDWKNILARTYPKEPPQVTPPKYNKEQESVEGLISLMWMIYLLIQQQ